MSHFLFITVSFLIGTLILHHLAVLPPNGAFFFYPLAVLCFIFVKQRLIIWFCIAIIGFGWAHLQAVLLLQQQLPEKLIGKDLTVVGHIASLPKKDLRKTRFEFDIEQFKDVDIQIKPGKVLLSWYRIEELDLNVGDKWQFTVRLKPPRNFSNPAGFDYIGWLLQKRILNTGYIRDKQPAMLIESEVIDYPVSRLRQTIRDRLQVLQLHEHSAPFINALLIGDRVGLQPDDWSVLQKTGTTHLMAISGLHIGLISGFAFLVGRFLWSLFPSLTLRFAAPRAAAIFAWSNAVIYAALAGFTIPTQRALIMLSVVLLFVVLKKQARPAIVLCSALFIVLVFDSFAVLSASFWLSFFAVSLIYYFIYIRYKSHSQGYARIRQWLGLQLMISIGLLPLTIQFFQQAPFISPVANLVAVPVVGFLIVPLCFIGGVLLFLNEAMASGIFKLATSIFDWLWQLLEWLSQLPISNVSFAAPSLFVLVLAVLGFLIVLMPRKLHLRFVGLICIVPLFFPFHSRPPVGEVRFSVLDVGQGLASVIQTKNHVLVFDTGPRFSARFDTGRAVIVPYLRNIGINHVDTLIVSHGDNDHIGGAESLIRNIKVNKVISSVPNKLSGAKSENCYRGQSWQWDQVQFHVLHPAKSDYEKGLSKNNLSCVLQVVAGQQRFLLSGDIERQAEIILSERYHTLQSDILVVPHHGSKTSSTEEFIKQVKPQLAIIPAGWRNRYRFPHKSVIQSYQEQGSNIINTATSGAVIYDSETASLTRFRSENLRYWEPHDRVD